MTRFTEIFIEELVNNDCDFEKAQEATLKKLEDERNIGIVEKRMSEFKESLIKLLESENFNIMTRYHIKCDTVEVIIMYNQRLGITSHMRYEDMKDIKTIVKLANYVNKEVKEYELSIR